MRPPIAQGRPGGLRVPQGWDRRAKRSRGPSMAHCPSCIRVWEPAGSCVHVSPWPGGLSTHCGRVELGLKKDRGPEGELGPAA